MSASARTVIRSRRSALRVFAAAALSMAAHGALQQEAFAFPEKPIRIMIPLPPGSVSDVVIRIVQPHLTEALGKPLIIEHRPGASGLIGSNAVANAEPDGHSLLLVTTTHSINSATRPSQKGLRTLQPVIMIGRNSQLFLVNPGVNARSLRELVALAKAEPQKYSYSTPGLGTQAHLLMELWSTQAGIQLKHVPYPGGPPAVRATVTGESHMTLISPLASLAQVRAGELRPLATGGAEREAELPDVPTTAEAGFPEFRANQWIGVLAPQGTPRPIIEKLNAEMQAVLKRADVREQLGKLGMMAAGGSPEEFGALIDSEIRQWTDVAGRAGIKLE
jgi:tripartite-type tricarboxylate transporter receptor subunit TctC